MVKYRAAGLLASPLLRISKNINPRNFKKETTISGTLIYTPPPHEQLLSKTERCLPGRGRAAAWSGKETAMVGSREDRLENFSKKAF